MPNVARYVAIGVFLILVAPQTATRARDSQAPVRGQPQDRGASTTALANGSRIRIGGDDDPFQVLRFDRSDGTWRLVAMLNTGRTQHTATVLADGRILIAGGFDLSGRLVSDVEIFDPETGTTSPLDAGLAARAGHTATLLTDGRVLVAGGEHDANVPFAQVWDPTTGTLRDVAAGVPEGVVGGRATLLADGRVLLDDGRAIADSARGLLFDPAAGTLVAGVAPNAARLDVVFADPADASTDVPLERHITVRFSEPIDVSGGVNLALTTAGGVPVAARTVIAEGGMLAFVHPDGLLAPDTEYHLRLNGLRTVDGRPFGNRTLRFSTRASTLGDPRDPSSAHADDAKAAFASPWRKLPPLEGPAGETALAGQVLLLDGQPLPNVTLEIANRHATTDRTGRFVIALGGAVSGWTQLFIDGTTANRSGERYGTFEVAVQIVGKRSVALPYTIWMPRLDTEHTVRIDSPTREEIVLTTPTIPGLEVHVPANTVMTDHDGKVVREIGITPIPVDRPPFPLPSGVGVPVYFTVQPGGAYVHTSGSGPKGARIVYPNYRQLAPDTTATFWHYDPDDRGWYVYGLGRVTADGRQIAPNPGVAVYEFTGAMINSGLTPGDPAGNGPPDGDPVDLSTGHFVLDRTDLIVRDVIPLVVSRTYYTGDNGNRPFGIGTMHPYAMFLWSAQQYQEADLILPNGKRIHYVRTSGGTGYTDAVFEHTASPTPFYKSRIVWNGHGWDLTLKDGTVYVFGDEAPLQSMRDRFGNTVTITWSTTNAQGSGAGNIVKVTSPNGRYIAFTYDGSNRITQATDNIGRTVGYSTTRPAISGRSPTHAAA